MEKKNPTLLIGLGGTGAKAVDLITAEMKKRFASCERPFICVDTDEPEEKPAEPAASEYTHE